MNAPTAAQNDTTAPASTAPTDTHDELETELTSETFDNFIKTGYSFIDCWADWCTPCKMVEPTVLKIAQDWKGKIKVGKLDTDNNTDIALKFNILGIPTFLLFKDGVLVDRMTGLNPPPVFTQFLTRNYQEDEAMPAAA